MKQSVYKDYETMSLVALHYAKEHKCNYNIILRNPNENGEFDPAFSTYEFVLDSYFDKERDNVILMAKTDDILREEQEDDDYLLEALIEQSEKLMPIFAPTIHNPMPFTIIERPPQYKRDMPKIGRNALCSCGSGFKYKKCCIDK